MAKSQSQKETSAAQKRLTRDILLGFVRVHVLFHAAAQPVYGAALMEELASHGYDLSPGTLYPLLHGLEEAGFLERSEEVVEGKVRKYYEITTLGLQALHDSRQRIRELVAEVLEEEPT